MSFNKIIILGDSDVGKTSILRVFNDNKFNENEMKTNCVALRSVDYNYDGLQLKFAVWDTSSLPQFSEVVSLYYKDVSAAVIVYDVTNRSTFERSSLWINTIRKHSNIIKYIALVANKIDLRDRHNYKHVTKKEGQELARHKNVEFFETSAKLALNICELFSKTFDGMVKRYVLIPMHKSIIKYKAIILGDANVGKSSIIERLCGHPFPNWMDNTIGTQFNPVMRKVNQCSVVLEFWDTSDQTELMYYKNAHTVILVYDIQNEESFKNLQNYLNTISKLYKACDEMPLIVLLANKKDNKTERKVDFSEAKEFVDQNHVIDIYEEISAKSDQNFDKLLTKICKTLINIFPNIPLNQNIRIKAKKQNKPKVKNWFKCGAKYIED